MRKHVVFVQMMALIVGLLTNSSPAFAKNPAIEISSLRDDKGNVVASLAAPKVKIEKTWKENNLAPIGSASLTTSGDLSASGIKWVIHAAPASMGQYDQSTEPTIHSIKQSIRSSIRLAEIQGVKRVAIPLIGGGIFLSRLGVDQEELAYHIIDAARGMRSKVEIVFVGYKEEEVENIQKGFDKSKGESKGFRYGLKDVFSRIIGKGKTTLFKNSTIAQGSITDFQVHGAEAIVNAANMELQFGGGLSGVIGNATGSQASEVDAINRSLIEQLYK